MPNHIYIARQPILTAEQKTFGYELLFRAMQEDGSLQTIFEDGMLATARVLVNALNHVGMNNLVGEHYAFINVDEELLRDDIVFSIPRDRFVLEILEEISVSDEVMARIRKLKQRGYTLALDDVSCKAGFLEKFKPMFPYIDILKLDAMVIDSDFLNQRLAILKEYNFKLLAKKVENLEQFKFYQSIGCHLFQGYFFAKPDIVKKKNIDPAYKNIFKLINLLDSDVDIEGITQAFETQPEITIQLLRFMNSGLLGLSTTIRSISHAVTLLGKRPLKQWLLLIAFAKSQDSKQAFNSPLIDLALSRSKMMSEFMRRISTKSSDVHEAALVGILSLIDVITQSSLEDILNELRIDSELTVALIEHKGNLGILLELAICIEHFEMDKANQLLEKIQLSQTDMHEALVALG